MIPPWARTIRFRLTVTYSSVLFGFAALVVAGLYTVLSLNLQAAPLESVTVQKVWKDDQGEWQVREGSAFEAADIRSVEAAANHKTLGMLRDLSYLAIGGLFGASVGTGWWLSGRALRPVRRITATAREISATDLSRRIDLTGPKDELSALADTIDDMLGRLEGAFATQRQMVDDASHELRNPLAVVQANVEAVLSLDDVSSDERAQATALITRAMSRMIQLVEDLLASARRGSPAFEDVDVDLALIAAEATEEYALLAAKYGLRLTRRLSHDSRTTGDPQALRRAVDNLLSNALRLSPSGSEITVATGRQAGWAWTAVRDEGPGIAEDDQERIFDRFFSTTRDSNPSRSGPDIDQGVRQWSPGLGLAIVRQIVESHGGSVGVHSQLGAGSTFVLWLPSRSRLDVGSRSAEAPHGNPLAPLSARPSSEVAKSAT